MVENSASDQIFIGKLSEIIQANLGNENFGAVELSGKAGINQRSLNRKLKAMTGKTLNQFIRETRLNKALEMLQQENLTASEVAYKTGFSSPAYFNTCFHEFFGYPPGAAKRKELDNLNGTLAVHAAGESKLKRPVRKPLTYALAGFILLTLFLYLAYNVFLNSSSSGNSVKSSDRRELSIAVLPFKNLSDSSANQYFIDGLMDEILTSLSRIHDLRVVSRTSVEQFRNTELSTKEIAKKLKVRYIVEGSGQKYSNIFRLRVQLIEAFNDRHLWAESYEQEMHSVRDIFNIQSQVAEAIAGELKATITPEEKHQIEKTPTSNLTAYDLFQRGNDELSRYPFPAFNKESVKKAESFFLNSLKYDSSYAMAYVGLAYVHWKRWDNDNELLKYGDINTYLDSMFLLANKALTLDNQLTEAFRIRGGYYSVKGTTEQALEEWNKALEYKPNDGDTYRTIGGFYEELDIPKSLDYLQKAAFVSHGAELTRTLISLAYDYYKAGFSEKGNYLLLEVLRLDQDSVKYLDNMINCQGRVNGEYRKALEHFGRRYLMDSTNENTLLYLGYYNSLTGKNKESLKYYKKYLSVIHGNEEYNSRLTRFARIGYAYLKCGFQKEADYYIKNQIEICQKRLSSVRPGEKIYWLYPLAGSYADIGDKKKAYENLNEFNRAGSFTLEWVTLLKKDPQFNSIRNEPEFQRILKEVESKYLAEHERVGKWLGEQGKL